MMQKPALVFLITAEKQVVAFYFNQSDLSFICIVLLSHLFRWEMVAASVRLPFGGILIKG
jgi:hypothetical protein